LSKGKKNSALWEDYKKELHDMWTGEPNGDHMVEYNLKTCAELVALPNGMLHDIEKHGITTHLCFGYSDIGFGPTYEEACTAAQAARESGAAFLSKNMETYTNALHNLEQHGSRHFVCMASRLPRIKGIRYVRVTDVLEAVGGSAVLEDLKGTEVDVHGERVYICTDEDVALLRAGYERAAAAHEKKLRAYLKRYGTSKLHIWTYWMDD
jgi:hypothetical protein